MVMKKRILKGGSSIGKGTRGSVSQKTQDSTLKYIFIGCLLCCLIPGLYKTFTRDIDVVGIIACKFGEPGGSMGAHLGSESVIEKMKGIYKTSVDVSKSVVKNIQEITITDASGDEYKEMTDVQAAQRIHCPAPGIKGHFGYTVPFPAYGCNYDVNQFADVEISEIKEDIVRHTEEINNVIMNNLKAQVSGSSGSSDKKKNLDFMNKQRDSTREIVRKSLLRSRNNSIRQFQEANVLKIRRPIACGCGENRNPKINQGIQFEIYARELSEDVKSYIHNKALDNNIDIEFEGVKQGFGQQLTCILQIITCTASLLGFMYIVYLMIKG
jgi:hypothetical protein